MNDKTQPIGDAELRMALRGLRQDVDPGQDLWPGVASRIANLPQQSASPKPRQSWLWPLATAASLMVAVGVVWKMQPSTASPARWRR